MPRQPPIAVEGLQDFQRALRRHADTDLPRRIGQAHKEVGKLVISRLDPRPVPAAVGEGSGTTVRPSASKREVLLRVGHARRATKAQQWGKRQVFDPGSPPARPFIVGTARRHQAEIEQTFLRAVTEAMRPAFHSTD